MTLQDFSNRLTDFLTGKASPIQNRQVNRWLQKLETEALHEPDNGEFKDSHSRMLAAINQGIANQSRLLTLQLNWFYAAAGIILFLVAGFVFRLEIYNVIDPVTLVTYTTPTGEQRLVILPDSTEVWLNAASTLLVPDEFRGNTRSIRLKGEAFFKVRHDASKPFYVHSGKTFTRVLGTSFNVKAYSEDEPVDITVVTGKVAVGYTDSLDQQHEIARLLPNRHIRLQAVTHAAQQDSVNAERAITWTKQQLVFQHATLDEVMLTLERWYSVSIQIAPATAQSTCTFSADYRNGTTLEDILKALELTGKLSYTRNNKSIIFYPRNNCSQ